MTYVISLLHEKGGVAKTTTVVQIAVYAASLGKKTLVIDGDTQGGATEQLLDKNQFYELLESDKTTAKVLKNPECVNECVWKTSIENLDLLPSKGDLNRVINELMFNPLEAYPVRLREALQHTDYDLVVIDNNPYFSLFTMNAIVVSDIVIIPTDMERGSIERLKSTIEDIASVIKHIKETKRLDYRILPVKLKRMSLDKQMLNHIKKIYEGNVFQNTIRYQAKPVENASLTRQFLVKDISKTSGVAQDYRTWLQELFETIRGEE